MEALKKTSISGDMPASLSGNYIVHRKKSTEGLVWILISGSATVSFSGDLET